MGQFEIIQKEGLDYRIKLRREVRMIVVLFQYNVRTK